MSEERKSWIAELLSFIDSGAEPSHLVESEMEDMAPELLEEGVALFGSWESALVATLFDLRRANPPKRAKGTSSVARPERVVGADAESNLYVVGRDGQVYLSRLSRWHATEEPMLLESPSAPAESEGFDTLSLGGARSSALMLTNRGHLVCLDHRLLPEWDEQGYATPISRRFPTLNSDDSFVAALAKPRASTSERMYFYTQNGQVKVSDSKHYERVSLDALDGVLVKEDDVPLGVFDGRESFSWCLVSSHGKALVCDSGTIRSQGRKAGGVRGIGLDEGARVVTSFVLKSEYLGLVTAKGAFKRMRSEEFRAQGRGGGGLQTCKLNPGDEVVGMVDLPLDGDVLVWTTWGRYTRFPAFDLPEMGRAARGDALVELGDGEEIAGMAAVPAGELEA